MTRNKKIVIIFQKYYCFSILPNYPRWNSFDADDSQLMTAQYGANLELTKNIFTKLARNYSVIDVVWFHQSWTNGNYYDENVKDRKSKFVKVV